MNTARAMHRGAPKPAPVAAGLLILLLGGGCGDPNPAVANTAEDAPPDEPASTIQDAAAPEAGPSLDPRAVAIVERVSDYLGATSQFSIVAETGYDSLQPSGQKIEFGAHREVAIARPDRADIRFVQRDGVSGGVVLDGENITIYNNEEKVYATVEQPGDIDASLDYLFTELGVPTPMREFFSSEPRAVFLDSLVSATFAMTGGTFAMIAGNAGLSAGSRVPPGPRVRAP